MGATTTVESNKKLIRRVYDEFMNEGKAELLWELYAPDFVAHGVPGDRGDLTGREAIEQYFQGFRETFPDLQATVELLVAEDDLVAVRNTYTGTHEGEFMGVPATGETVTFVGEVFFRIEEGQISETWGLVDTLDVLQQLGATEVSAA